MTDMRPIPLALLSAALLLPLPLAGQAQTGGVPPSKVGPQQAPQASRTRQLSGISLSGRYLAARVAEQDHDYEAGADQLDLALGQAPGDAALRYDAFRLRVYAGRLDAAAQLAPLVDWADLDGALLIKNDVFDGMQIVDGRIALNDRPGIGVVKRG